MKDVFQTHLSSFGAFFGYFGNKGVSKRGGDLSNFSFWAEAGTYEMPLQTKEEG